MIHVGRIHLGVPSLVVLLLTVAGSIIAIVEPSTLSFHELVKDLGIAWGLIGIGKGLDSTNPEDRP